MDLLLLGIMTPVLWDPCAQGCCCWTVGGEGCEGLKGLGVGCQPKKAVNK